MFKILVVEDEEHARKLIVKSLTNNGYDASESQNGKEALEIFNSRHFDMVITDVMMPLIDGIQMSKMIRQINQNIPILMLTALESYDDKERAYYSGIDDYMVKPIETKEMLLRVKALLRRYKIETECKIELDNFKMEKDCNTVISHHSDIELSKKEHQILFKLLSNPNRIFTREQFLQEFWSYDSESEDRTIDTHIKRIREKINCEDFEIVTVRGLGYKAVLSKSKSSENIN